MDITAVGVDLAKHVFQIHAIDAQGHTVLRKHLSRSQMVLFFTGRPVWSAWRPAAAHITGHTGWLRWDIR